LAAVELVHHMEGSTHFQTAQLVQESEIEGGAVVATVIATYIPEAKKGTDK